jgi:hypothetical protein
MNGALDNAKKTLLDQLRDFLPHLFFGGGAGAGVMIVYLLVQKEPRLALEVIKSWGAPAMLGLVAMVLVDRGFRNLIQVGRENAVAQQRLADAVQEIASRDNAEAVQQRAIMDHVATQTEKILTRLDELDQAAPRKEASRGASA